MRAIPEGVRRRRFVALCAGLGACVLAVDWVDLLVRGPSGNPPIGLIWAVGILAIPLFGSAGILMLVVALSPGPAILMDERGLSRRTPLRLGPPVPWDEIVAIRRVPIPVVGWSGPWLGLDVRDPESFVDGLPWWKRWGHRRALHAGRPLVTLDLLFAASDPVTLTRAIRRWAPAAAIDDLLVKRLSEPPQRCRARAVGRLCAWTAVALISIPWTGGRDAVIDWLFAATWMGFAFHAAGDALRAGRTDGSD